MANPAELWMKEYGEASRLAEEVSKMLSEYGSHLPSSRPETLRHLSSIRRHITNLGIRLGMLEADLSSQQKKSTWFRKKEIERRKKMLSNLRERETRMTLALNMWYAANGGEDLVGSSQGAIKLQEEIIQEQDESSATRHQMWSFDDHPVTTLLPADRVVREVEESAGGR
ncbi:hypothetical protein LUZ61_017618 [Rhynchospora tenuis]|uniref:Uncharacterized protein n=1 Tax=Rhynchospora tenuis TaxID=198213 RepID=A0AAD5Z7W1_9POAL|nr:hypothetical protein LUZ61_017618 [Rhynchospora tenuis]